MFKQVLEFHETYGQEVNAPAEYKLLKFRFDLIDEEVQEVAEQFAEISNARTDNVRLIHKVKLTKELVDLLYVTLGAGVALGLPLENAFEEVHRSNMSKLGEDGKPIKREDGKVLKGPNYFEPNLEQFFNGGLEGVI